MFQVTEEQYTLLRKAVNFLEHWNYCPYLKLKRLFIDKPAGYQADFRRIFISFYGLNQGGLTDTFRDRYFELLFGLELKDGVDPYTPILKELHGFERKKGDNALHGSFVSKLVAMHDESYPIFDRHVGSFFGISRPPAGDIDLRISKFVSDLTRLRETYRYISQKEDFIEILKEVKEKKPDLETCTPPRIADFLIWTIGNNKLYQPARRS